MPENMSAPLAAPEILAQLSTLRRENRRMHWLVAGALLVSVFSFARSSSRPMLSVSAAVRKDDVLHVRGLIVEDANGVERVRLGAPLPDPMGIDGQRHHRQGIISGMLISDAKGTERGGYVTADASDEAFFSLDSRKGQEVLFLANPDGGTNLDLFDKSGNEAQLTVFPNGPKLVMKRNHQVIAQLPQLDNVTK